MDDWWFSNGSYKTYTNYTRPNVKKARKSATSAIRCFCCATQLKHHEMIKITTVSGEFHMCADCLQDTGYAVTAFMSGYTFNEYFMASDEYMYLE